MKGLLDKFLLHIQEVACSIEVKVPHLLVPVLAAVFIAGCGQSPNNSEQKQVPAGSFVLNGAGSTFIAPIFDRWFADYHTRNPKIYVKYDVVGSGEGVRRFIGKNIDEKERVDFGASDAALQDSEIAQADNNAVMIPVTAGCVVLAYNLPDFHDRLRLSRQAYAGIFLGEVKNWDDPLITQSNPGVKLPDLTIMTAVRRDSSGTTYAFTKHLDAISEKWRSNFGPAKLVDWPGNAMRANGNEGVAGLIQNSQGSIGYVGYEFTRLINLPVALLENKEGNYVDPSEASCKAGLATAQLPDNLRVFVPDPSGADSYPIVTFSWALLYKKYGKPETAAALRELFKWCLTDGQQYAPALNYLPLPDSVVKRDLDALNNVN